jgi:hypothetical protein
VSMSIIDAVEVIMPEVGAKVNQSLCAFLCW